MPKVIHEVRAIREERPKPTGPREDLRGEASLRGGKVLQCFALWKEMKDLGLNPDGSSCMLCV